MAIGMLFVLVEHLEYLYSYLWRLGSGCRLIEVYDTRERVYLHETVCQTVHIFTDHVVCHEWYLHKILFKDKKQELMIFATGHIYRETGTASKDVEKKSFVRKIKSEKSIL